MVQVNLHFLKIVSGKDEFFDGNITKGKNIRIEYLPQNEEFNDDEEVIKAIFKGDTPEMKLLMDYEKVVGKLSTEKDNESLNKKFLDLQGKIDSMSLWDLESSAKSILNKLGINDYNQKMGNLSGGQKKRVALSRALITPCDLLILDEPTNHLDADSIEWLENYLNSRKGALLMITHDRYFLDRVSNRTIELDRGNLYVYEGNYTKFLEKKQERIEREATNEQKRQSLIRKELKWVKRGAKARSTKQKARLERFNELVNQNYEKPREDIDMCLIGTRLGKKIIEIDSLCKNFDDNVIIKDFSYIFTKGDRIGVIGPNGAGKTTLIRLLEGEIQKSSGSIEIGETVKMSCFAQDDSHMDFNMKAIDYIKEGGEVIEVSDGSKITAGNLCERFMFDGDLQYSKIENLSGGERRRLHLLRVLMESPNVLLLDEPTNDLDINTLTILEDFLDSFIGVVVVVSHDRYFLDRICNKIFSYEGNGFIKKYCGNYSDVQLQKEFEKPTDNDIDKNEKETENNTQKRVKERDLRPKFSFKEKMEYEKIEDEIAELENNISEIEKQMEENATSYGKLEDLSKEKEEIEEKLMEKYERFEYLQDIADKIEEYKKQS